MGPWLASAHLGYLPQKEERVHVEHAQPIKESHHSVLLDGDGLSQIPWLVDVRASHDRNVVG
jgi:hypothetical protein